MENKQITVQEIEKRAQELHDKDNWTGLTQHERLLLIAMQLKHIELTGKPLELKYNCPA